MRFGASGSAGSGATRGGGGRRARPPRRRAQSRFAVYSCAARSVTVRAQRVVICSDADTRRALCEQFDLVGAGVAVTSPAWCLDCISGFFVEDPNDDVYQQF